MPPPQKKILNFYIKMVSSGAFWVAISYRLSACFTGIGSTCGVEIYWRSFRHFGNYNYSLRKTVGKKVTKMGQKLIKKIAQKSRCFCTFSSESVKRVMPKITSWKSRGACAPVPHSWRRQCTALKNRVCSTYIFEVHWFTGFYDIC